MKVQSFFQNIFPHIAAMLFIILFVYAGTTKVLDYQKFRVQLGQSPLLTAYKSWIVWLIPAIEFFIAGMLSFSKSRLVAFYAAFALMIVFSAYIVAITQFSDYIPCSCGGILQHMSWSAHLIFNLAFISIALTAILFTDNKSNKDFVST